MKKKFTILSVFLCILMLVTTAFAAKQMTQKERNEVSKAKELVEIDQSANISREQQIELAKKLEEIGQKHNINVGVYITSFPSQGKSAEQAARERLKNRWYQTGKNGSMILVVYTQSRDYYIATDRGLNKIIPSKDKNGGGLDYVKKQILPGLKDSNYEKAIVAFGDAVEKEMVYFEKEGKPYDPSAGFSIMAAVVALVGAAITFAGVRSYLIGQMSNVALTPAADEYLDKASFKLTDEDDTFLYTNVSAVPKSKSRDDDNDTSDDSGDEGGSGGKF